MSAKQFFHKTERPAKRGETIQETVKTPIEKNYGQLYRNAIAYLHGRKDKHRCAYAVLFLVSRMQEGSKLPSVQNLLTDWIKEGENERSLFEVLKALCNAKVLRRPKKGLYLFNPAVVWNGSSSSRNQEIAALLATGEILDPPTADETYVKLRTVRAITADGPQLKIAK